MQIFGRPASHLDGWFDKIGLAQPADFSNRLI